MPASSPARPSWAPTSSRTCSPASATSSAGRSATYERELRSAREIAVSELKQAALEVGANAVVGVDIDYETVGGSGSMLMVSVSGTAVVVE